MATVGRDARVLVVDDEPIILKSCDRVLTRAGYRVNGVSSGREGLDQVRRNGFDLLLLDLKMPDMNGIEILRQVRQIQRELKVIIITAYPSMETMAETMKLGAYDYVIKPFTPDELVSSVKKVIGQEVPAIEEGRGPERIIEYHAKRRVQKERLSKGKAAQSVIQPAARPAHSLGLVRSIETINRGGEKVAILGLDGTFDNPRTLADPLLESLKERNTPTWIVYGTHEVTGIEILDYLAENDRVVLLTPGPENERAVRVREITRKTKEGDEAGAAKELPQVGYPQVADWARAMGIDTEIILVTLGADRGKKAAQEVVEALKGYLGR